MEEINPRYPVTQRNELGGENAQLDEIRKVAFLSISNQVKKIKDLINTEIPAEAIEITGSIQGEEKTEHEEKMGVFRDDFGPLIELEQRYKEQNKALEKEVEETEKYLQQIDAMYLDISEDFSRYKERIKQYIY
ncbi:hypothetical protein AX774_g3488 [Zancudomyces culisetae]|uniref:Uncharacterized protein n=1 Tax=Zancudomyces culisetae TaxID=1213189 RepID=A0A1R1PPZ7_ZANCU|nr:hypothetical protein AX774_g3488 [Zancudomyces culisetae]|eukprot:OMH83011.1 hypothetical protein AX774_g3488 [Zancudomyces culisetae]